MSLRQKRKLSLGLETAGVVTAFIGVMVPLSFLTAIGLVLLAAGVVVRAKGWRCPHCGRYLGRDWPDEGVCVHCWRPIDYDKP